MRVFYVSEEYGEYGLRDSTCRRPESLRELNISLDDIRSVTGSGFPEFDEVRSWTPVSPEELMESYVAFGPSEEAALVVQFSEHGNVETMHFHIWYISEASIPPHVAALFRRIAARWELLFETLNHTVVIRDEASLASYIKYIKDRSAYANE